MLSTREGETRTMNAVRVAASFDEMLAGADARSPFKSSDSRSGSRFERVSIGGVAMVLKYLCVDDDWIMRGTGDLDCRVLTLIESGVVDQLPECIDHAMVAAAPYVSQHGHRGAALLMRDVGDLLVPPGDDKISPDSHRRYLEHMAALHAEWWGRADAVDVFPLAHHYTFLTPTMAVIEAERGGADPVPKAVAEGWAALRHASPRMAATLGELAADPGPLVGALAATPLTLVHGDWKFGNMGEHADGRTVLLDWDRCGAAPATLDLAWYLAINCARLPEHKEGAIAAYRDALERLGVATAGWWDRQLALTLVGAALQLAWNKAGEPEELGWWQDRVTEGERFLA
jgi:Phosphotransferase enzyme family